MAARRDVVGSKSSKDHLKKMESVLKKTQDPLLREHIRRLRRAWGSSAELQKAA